MKTISATALFLGTMAATTSAETLRGLQAAPVQVCALPSWSPPVWYFNAFSNAEFGCSHEGNAKKPWTMLYAYRSGGVENVHWKYTDNERDPDCMSGPWNYYAEDGHKLLANIPTATTMFSSSRRWCALPVYRSGGAEGKQWSWCNSC